MENEKKNLKIYYHKLKFSTQGLAILEDLHY